MTNLVVSASCDMNCAYCFARDSLSRDEEGAVFITLAAFERRLDFLARSGVEQVRLIGGEPTLHPHFTELVSRARARGKPVVVFTHGGMPASALACLESLPATACAVVVNLNAAAGGQREDLLHQRQEETLRRLGVRAIPGYTIVHPGFSLDRILDLIERTGCRRSIRLGLAHPVLSGENRSLAPSRYRAVGQRIAGYAGRVTQAGVALEFDCGFVPCMFTPGELRQIKASGADTGWHCSPVLDIDLNERVLHCFSTAGWAGLSQQGLTQESAALRVAMEAEAAPYRALGMYRECSSCPQHADGRCPGGCLAETLRRFQPASAVVQGGVDESGWISSY